MSAHLLKRAPIVRLPPKSNVELLLLRSAQVATIVIGLVALALAVFFGRLILLPISLAIVIGLMFGPLATRMERRGLPPAASAAVVLMIFIIVTLVVVTALATPLTYWLGRLPQIWSNLQLQLSAFRAPFEALASMRDQMRELTGSDGVSVSVDDGAGVATVATLAPALVAQALLFFASLYFFVATRNQTRIAILKLCINRRLRWRVAHIFRDVESLVSRYLFSITAINIGEGAAVGLALFLLDVPSALLWGVMAGLANFVPFIGPAVVVALLFIVGLAESDTLTGSLTPVLVYLSINLIESQFVTPIVIGRAMTLNPFIVLLALAFWIWMWGPFGGFVAIPVLLIFYAIIRNIVPGADWLER